ncbi:MAG: hybrid sensor histidine kinase/response regulator [Magnetococcales bacterium]|nr:hybrid sensor histidine kinase/response regulator [Magnetococcales bacterium]
MDKGRQTLLIVDDERFNLNLLHDLLETDYDIQIALNGEQALQRAACETPPDLILLDIMMPGMDGYEVLRRLKAHRTTRTIPVIFVTAMGQMADETKGLELGAVDYIIKPISPPILRARVQTHLILKQSLDRQRELNQDLSLLNEELVQKKDELQALNQLKNLFLGMAAHDLRNPIVSIRGLSHLMLEETLEIDAQREFIASIHQVSEQMLALLNDLLDVSAIESGQMRMTLEPNDMIGLLQGSVELLQPTARAKNIRLILEHDDPPPPPLLFDRMRLAQVVENVLSNAIKFSPLGGVVRILTLRDERGAGFAVEDQGPGISAEDRARLFKPFQKLGALPTAGEKSTGMGLFIVKKIVDAHGGSIRVDNPPEGGCRFTIQWPMVDG